MKQTLQQVLYDEIPLTKPIGISVEDCSMNTVTLSAPLENNINHKNTAFGGSLYSVSVLAGWSMIYTLLKENNLQGNIVIYDSNIRFLVPVADDIVATCHLPAPSHTERFLKTYRKKGKARIKLESHIPQKNNDAVIFEGTYVVHQ